MTSFAFPRFILRFGVSSKPSSTNARNHGFFIFSTNKRRYSTSKPLLSQQSSEAELLVVVGGGAAGIYGAIRAKTIAPNLNVVVIEKGKPLSKVKISGGGRCNVTNGHCSDNLILAEHYPRGNKELRGSFFSMHGPKDTMSWFSDLGVELKTEDDGRVFPVSNNSSSVVDCLLSEAKQRGVLLQTGKVVTTASVTVGGKFLLKIEKRTIDFVDYVEADYLLIASGSSKQGYTLATQVGHSIVEPVPSLFTFKIDDPQLAELSGVTFPKVKAKLKLETVGRSIPQLTQVGPMLVTHWGLSGPVILRLSAWGARNLFSSDYEGILHVDFIPDVHIDDVKSILIQHKNQFVKQKVLNWCPSKLGLVKRFWKYILDREGLNGDILWASVSNNTLLSVASLLKQYSFRVKGKGQFKDEFVTAGGVPLSEITLSTMESKIQSDLFFAGEVLNIDGVTGGFNFQNAWSGGYIAGTSIGNLAVAAKLNEEVVR
ncbi:uncharacterized protein LOC114267950 isoform X3 [Camellia sinensis]|uniref:FAD/NAD(P)-binding domain-containing protein n=1 Tax=Camellia sinensis TaxID=4442 RepID=A0A7J7IB09_CAMSI|nr:uncharacterized protein LOC114267950 isoform X3 [Camellia sinensis]KAF5961777.1 hypothetical protein HYC85_002986 [Camellia sinensis]